MKYSEKQLIQLADIIERGIAGEDIDLAMVDQYSWDDDMMVQVEPYLHDRKALRWLWQCGPIENCRMYDFEEYKERADLIGSVLHQGARRQNGEAAHTDEDSDNTFMLLYLNMIQMQFLFLCDRVRKTVTNHPEWFDRAILDGLNMIMTNEIENSDALKQMLDYCTE